MDYRERESLLRRLCSRKLYAIVDFQHQQIPVIITDPSIELLSEADFIYKQRFNELKSDDNMFTLEESYDILREDGLWTNKMEKELIGLPKDIEQLESKLHLVKFQKNQQKAIMKAIDKLKKRTDELFEIKNQLWPSTIEYLAEKSKKRFIMSKSIYLNSEHADLEQDINFIDRVTVLYYVENVIKESHIRQLARTDPWRLYWSAAKSMGTSLFPCSSIEMTEYQKQLVFWTKVYDFAYESTNRPTDDIVDDDDRFDLWYKEESERIKREIKQSSLENSIGNTVGQEVFIPADRDGANEVYNLNNNISRNKIKERQKAIIKKGKLNQVELPDVKQELQMQYNQMSARR